jgi:anti-sigma factor RsiW
VDPLVTAYVDGEIGRADREMVDKHLRVCPPCRSRVVAEQAVRGLIETRRAALAAESAPVALRARCAESLRARAHTALPERRAPWQSRAVPLALAATLVLAVSWAFLYQLTDRSANALAAELTADHVKCFGLVNALLGTRADPAAIERSMASKFGWTMHLPDAANAVGLTLVGARPCLYARGVVAHLMYRHNGQPVSVFMLPKTARREDVVDVMGHEAVIWSEGDRTFVLISGEPRAEIAQVTTFVRASLH